MKVVYQEVSAAAIMARFARDFRFDEGSTLYRHEWFFDAAKGVVVFKLVVHEGDRATDNGAAGQEGGAA